MLPCCCITGLAVLLQLGPRAGLARQRGTSWHPRGGLDRTAVGGMAANESHFDGVTIPGWMALRALRSYRAGACIWAHETARPAG